jgi:hypothetical protein
MTRAWRLAATIRVQKLQRMERVLELLVKGNDVWL